MKKFFTLFAALVLASTFIACSSGSSGGGDDDTPSYSSNGSSGSGSSSSGSGSSSSGSTSSSSSPFDSSLAGGTYTCEYTSSCYTFNSNHTVTQSVVGISSTSQLGNWRIVDNGTKVEIYAVISGTVVMTFNVTDSSFNALEYAGLTFTRS